MQPQKNNKEETLMRARFTTMALLLVGMLVCFAAVQAEVTTEVRSGTVVSVDGNHLVIKFSTGELKSFDVPEDFRFTVDGKEVSVHELKPGTALTRTITTNTEPTTVYSTTVRQGKVWFVQAPTLIVTMADGKNKQFEVDDSVKFTVDGKEMTVYELKKGMNLTATIYHKNQSTIVTTTAGGVSGAAPAAAPSSSSSSSSSSSMSSTSSSSSGSSDTLPKTGSPLALLGMLGAGFLSLSYVVRRFRK
jgi:LPXTG-motif cell wall-anchored protein